jgi:hypothetical protein
MKPITTKDITINSPQAWPEVTVYIQTVPFHVRKPNDASYKWFCLFSRYLACIFRGFGPPSKVREMPKSPAMNNNIFENEERDIMITELSSRGEKESK